MLKHVRAVAESAGIITPNKADATAAAEQRRAELVAAQAAVSAAEAEVEGRYDASASAREIAEADAAHVNAKMAAERAQRHYAAAEKRLAGAREAETTVHKADALKRRD